MFAVTALALVAPSIASAHPPLSQSGLNLPWSVGESGTYLAGPHENNRHACTTPSLCNSLDFVPSSTVVRAAGPGTVHLECGNTLVLIDHENGWVTGYYHMPDPGNYVKNGEHVSAGTVLGHVGKNIKPCGGTEGEVAHVHFFIKYVEGGYGNLGNAFKTTQWDVALNGETLGGWKIDGNLGGSCMTYVATGEKHCEGAKVENHGTKTEPPPRKHPVGDYNGDFASDVLWYETGSEHSATMLAGGPNNFTNNGKWIQEWTKPDWAATGDFNGDGYGDVLWYETGNEHSATVLAGGPNNFSVKGKWIHEWTKPDWAGVGDFNGDGKTDVLWYEVGNEHSATMLAGGTEGFSVKGKWIHEWTKPDWAGVGDFNCDGKSDVLWYETGNEYSATMLAGGTNGFTNEGKWIHEWSRPDWVGVGDFNGDGCSDVLWYEAGNHHSAKILLGGPHGFTNGGNWIEEWSKPDWVGVGDFNGDNKSDVLWYEAGNNHSAKILLGGASGFTNGGTWIEDWTQPDWAGPSAGGVPDTNGGASMGVAFTADTPPEAAQAGAAYSYTFTASGTPQPLFSLASGSLPPGLSLDATTGALSGTPSSAGTYSFTVKAANGPEADNEAVSPSIAVTVSTSSQTISFTSSAPPSPNVGSTYGVAAASTSGLPVAFSIDPASRTGACALTGAMVQFKKAGRCIVDANQGGNSTYEAAPQVQQTIEVTAAKASTTTNLTSSGAAVAYGNEPSEVFSVSMTAAGGGTIPSGKVKVTSAGKTLCTVTIASGEGRCSPKAHALKAGTYSVVSTFAGTSHFTGSTSAPVALEVTP